MRPLLRVANIPVQTWRQAYPGSVDYTTPSQAGSFTIEKTSAIPNGTWVPGFYVKADDSNTKTVYLGGSGAATFPLAVVNGVGESLTYNLPEGRVLDLSAISVDGRGNSGQILHFFYSVIIPRRVEIQ